MVGPRVISKVARMAVWKGGQTTLMAAGRAFQMDKLMVGLMGLWLAA